MIKKVLNIRQEIVYQNPQAGESYRRVVGGLAWPALPEPGYLVVLGELWAKDEALQARPLRVLAEREGDSIEALYRLSMELRYGCVCDTWLADMNQSMALRMWRRLNQGQGMAMPLRPLLLRPAPYSQGDGCLQTLFQILAMVQDPDRKVLSYGQSSKLPGYALGLDAKDMGKPAAHYPPLAALGYAVAEMVMIEPADVRRLQQLPVTCWDRYQFAGRGN